MTVAQRRRVDGTPGEGAAATVRPGALTALLADLVRAPRGAGWEAPPMPGDRVGRFEIVREIGRGGFGVVYEARDAELNRSVALKTLRLGEDAETAAQSVAEAEAAARLAHPNIVHLYDVGRDERGAYLIMELLRGKPLSEWVGQPVPVRDAVRAGVEIARGLAHAHSNGIVHRDLKPGNVFVCDDGQVKVLDFGLAHVFGRQAMAGGTPAYMAPEQAKGEIGDERSDLYSLGVILEHLLTTPGRRRIPPALTKLVARLRAADPAARPASARDVLAQLTSIQTSLEPKRLLWASIAVALIAIAAAIGFAVRARPLPPGRLLVAMADTANSTGDPDLDAVGDLLRAGLEQSRRVSVMARSRLVNALAQMEDRERVVFDEARARQAALASGAQLLVVPAVRQTAEGVYEVSVRALDLQHHDVAFSVRDVAGAKSTLAELLDRVVRRMRRELKEDALEAPAAPVAVAELAPANAEALRHYAEGQQHASEAKPEEAVHAFERAVTVDPEFALARLAILEAVYWDGAEGAVEPKRIEEHRRAIQRSLDRLPPRERAYAETLFLPSESIAQEVEKANRAIAAWPEDPRPYVHTGFLLLIQKGDLAAARPYLEKAVVLAPLTTTWAIDFLLALGRLDEALDRAKRWADRHPNPVALFHVSEVHRIRGELPQALELARRGAASGGTFSLHAFIDADRLEEAEELVQGTPRALWWLKARGRMREARALWEAKRRPPPDAPLGKRIDHQLSMIDFSVPAHDVPGIWRSIEAAFRMGGSPGPCVAWALAIAGDVERARSLTEIGNNEIRYACQRAVAALSERHRGSREEALRLLDGIYLGTSHLYRGEILFELGRDREALEEVRRYQRFRNLSPYDHFYMAESYPRSLYVEAKILERLGDRGEAASVIRRLLRLWERADRDLPLLKQAKALQRRLAGNAG